MRAFFPTSPPFLLMFHTVIKYFKFIMTIILSEFTCFQGNTLSISGCLCVGKLHDMGMVKMGIMWECTSFPHFLRLLPLSVNLSFRRDVENVRITVILLVFAWIQELFMAL